MYRLSLALLFLLVAAIPAASQSVARANRPAGPDFSKDSPAVKAVAELRRLDQDVFRYRSLGEFEENGKLARVSLEKFRQDLQEAAQQVEPIIFRLPEGKLRTEIANALDSYRDGAFWWQQIDRPRVVHVSALTSTNRTQTPAGAAFISTVPYTVVIHWRQADGYLNRAEEILKQSR